MANHANPFPQNSYLEAVLLVIKSGVGPRCVLRYPPEPQQHEAWASTRRKAREAGSSSSEPNCTVTAEESDDFEDSCEHSWRHARTNERTAPNRTSLRMDQARPNLRHEISKGRSRDITSRKPSDNTRSRVEATDRPSAPLDWKNAKSTLNIALAKSWSESSHHVFLGYSADSLAKLLLPTSRTWHKRRLEINIGRHCFVGCPMFCREDGRWAKPLSKSRGRHIQKRRGSAEQLGSAQSDIEAGAELAAKTVREVDQPATRQGVDKEDLLDEIGGLVDGRIEAPTSSLSSTPSSADWYRTEAQGQMRDILQSFNVVFVLCPPTLEHQMRVRELYGNVIKTLAVALRHQQRREDYVWNQARIIHASREKAIEKGLSAVEAWSVVSAESSLARALMTTFDCISISQIAHISLGPSFDLSLQIPQGLSTTHVPTPQNSQIPGLWLTSAELTASHNGNHGITISPQSALLLLVSTETLTRELAASTSAQREKVPNFAGPLAYFIRHCNPAKTLSQLSRKLRLSLPDLQFLSLHLIRWRRARAITPLHPSHIYVPSPNASMQDLPVARETFRRRFTAVPDLVAVLAKLGDNRSNAPRPWSTQIPSNDHKDMYMEVLAWLVRGGWVCQIRTFAWVVVTPHVKKVVEQNILREERDLRTSFALAAMRENMEDETLAEDQSVDIEADDSLVSKRRLSIDSGRTNTQTLFSPRMRATLFPPKPSSVAGSVSSGQTAVRIVNAPCSEAGGQQKDHSRQSSNGVTAEEDSELDQKEYYTSLVLSPHKATTVESRWLEYIGQRLPDEDLRQAWPSLVKYFDGQHAVEEIAIREEKKRKIMNPILIRLISLTDVLRIVRHW